MIELNFDTIKQVNIFFQLINKPNGLERNELVNTLLILRTTLYDNLVKLMNRNIDYFPMNEYKIHRKIPYVKTFKRFKCKKGRPKIIFYIPKIIRHSFSTTNIQFKIKENNISQIINPIKERFNVQDRKRFSRII